VPASAAPARATLQRAVASLGGLVGAATWSELRGAESKHVADARRAEHPELADDDLIVPLSHESALLGALMLRASSSSPRPAAVVRRAAETLAATGALALAQAHAHEKLVAWNRTLGQRMTEAAQAARQSEARLVRVGQLARFGEFAAMVAHDLKAPLTFMRGELELLEERRRSGDATMQDVAQAIERLERHCLRMQHEIEAAMDKVRPAAAPSAEIDVDGLLRETAAMLGPRAAEAGVAIEVGATAGCRVRGNLDLLRHVLANLVLNAIEAMAGARATGRVRLSARRANGQVDLRVHDDGPGVPAELRGRLFRPFVSGKGGGGTGLGLASCRRIVEDEHGGEIRLDPDSERGACFVVRLPV
jgi:signal transduction histidine kinase